MNVKEHFDVIVVGAGIAPLSCAALLCKRGFRVLVVGAGEPSAGHVPAVTSDLGSPVTKRVLSELGIAQIVRRNEQALAPYFQIVTPGGRVSVHGDRDRLLAEYAREFPAEREAARMFYEDLEHALEEIDGVLESGLAIPPRGFIEKQRLRHTLASTSFGVDGLGGRLLAALDGSPSLRAGVLAHVVACSRLDRRLVAPVHAALIHGRAAQRSSVLEGGIAGLGDLLVHRISTTRGETKLDEHIEEIEVRRGRVVHVRLAGHDSATGCDHLVCGTEASALARLLREDGRRLDERMLAGPDLDVISHVASTTLVVRDEVFPEPMARLVYVLFDGSGAPGEGHLAVLERGEGPAVDTSLLRISFPVDHAGLLGASSHLDDATREVRRRLHTVIPFLDEFVEEEWGPIDAAPPQVDEEDPGQIPTRFLPCIYASREPGFWGACGLPWATRLRNLVICSHQVLPGLGSEGLWLAAWGAAGLVSSKDPSKARWKSRTQRWSM